MNVRHLDIPGVQLVQSRDEVEEYNKQYAEDFEYYFLDEVGPNHFVLYGSYGINKNNEVYQVGEI